jgi:hypothetical protein
MIPAVVPPVTVVVRIEAVELTGVAVRVDDVIAAGFIPFGLQETWN